MSDLLPLLLAAGPGGFGAAALAALVLARRPAAARVVPHVLAIGAGTATAVAGVLGIRAPGWRADWPGVLPPPGAQLALDGLGGFFLVLVGAASIPTSLYAIGYLAGRRRGVARVTCAYSAFVGTMALVPLAANVFTFLLVWELMSLASYFLVVADPDERGVLWAGWVYALVTHAGLACLAGGMLLLAAGTGSERFADWGGAAAALPAGARTAAFLLLALGFGSKAGLVPVHVWLPLAHPAAPSHVSALMSGVMVKLGVYGLIRVGLEWLPGGPPWWGALLLLVAAVSAVLGVLYALVEHDLKRLLAYHTVENVGIITLGLGTAMVFGATGLDVLGRLGLLAALYHTANHAAFKALLFLGAGAVLHATGTRNMELLGGLVKRMPWTAACFLVGAAAISALPPLNGFVSEWLTFQALLQSFTVPSAGLNLVFVVALAGLALTGGLAAACFVKAFGITFLALPRSDAAARAHEAPVTARVAMVGLAVVCAGLGLGATLMVSALARVTAGVGGGAHRAAVAVGAPATIVVGDGFGTLSPAVVGLLLAVVAPGLVVGLRLVGARRDTRRYETWSCGRLLQTARMEYTATAFSQPFKRIFAILYRPEKQLEIDFHPDSRYFVRTIRYENPTRSVIEDWLYLPALTGVRRVASAARRVQSGSANLYLGYILAALLGVLLLAVR